MPACGVYNNGAWIKVVDGKKTAGAYPITIIAASGIVSGPGSPVTINVNRGGFVLTCDGANTAWLVTATGAMGISR